MGRPCHHVDKSADSRNELPSTHSDAMNQVVDYDDQTKKKQGIRLEPTSQVLVNVEFRQRGDICQLAHSSDSASRTGV